MRRCSIILFSLYVLVVAVAAARAQHGYGPWQSAWASWYSAESTGSTHQGCGGAPPLTDSALSVATFQVPCGARVEICYHGCVIATRWDSGPYVYGRLFDLNVGVRDAIGFGGVGVVRWRRVY